MVNISAHRFRHQCPECHAPISFTGAQAMHRALIQCPNGHEIRLEDNQGGLKQVDRALADFKKSFKNTNIKIRL